MTVDRISHEEYINTKSTQIKLCDNNTEKELIELLDGQFQHVAESIFEKDIKKVSNGWEYAGSRFYYILGDKKIKLNYLINCVNEARYEFVIEDNSWKISDLKNKNSLVILTFGENDKTIENFLNEAKQ
ncbi:hypothetical protein [Lysinibacillus sp. Bpr_S20]|uniref:hypothetical protein n=1 Tax=Lysinibacillus sp. Bpr_S20 TaxID=2933964 RepID=UPI002011E1E1|nr:hypothetical protein [Lysinibacillus sp. Bpr_S20]MCL1701610.1 hypothetical protein [Lysinibacillus sp. Bpr_S20]